MPYLYRISSDDTAMARWELADKPVVVGRLENATIWVPDYRVSGLHFVIRLVHGRHVIEDLASTNGTWLNHKRLAIATELKVGDRIQAGKTLFSYESGLATSIQECAEMPARP